MPVVDGLITGIDTESIINGLLDIRKKRIDELTSQQKEIQGRQSAFQQIEAQLLALRSQASTLGRAQNNVFDSRAATSSDEDAVSATATSKSAVGVFQVRVNSLAQAHQVASQGFTDEDAEISTGTFTFSVGGQSETTITVDSSNNSLQGLVDAINNAGVGVNASMIQDAGSPAAPYRLLLTAQKTGLKNAIQVTNNLGPSAGSAVRPEIDFDNPVQAAADASVQLGSGAGAIVASSDSNSVTGLINGVTLNLKEVNPDRPIAVTVARDSSAASDAVQGFVDAYNDLTDLFASQFKYVPETKQSGTLLGNQSAAALQQTVSTAVMGVVAGVNSKANRLSAIGVTITDTGKLSFNPSKLQDVIDGRVDGVTSDDVRRLFALDGQSTNGSVQFVIGSSRTGSPKSPVQIDITQAAEHAAITAGSSVASSVTIDGTNDTLSIRLDGASATDIKIAQGTYTAQELATQVETAINATSSLGGRTISVGLSGGALTVRSESYGATSEIAVSGGTALASLGFSGTESDFGVDVAGSFIVDGVTETAKGRGRLLVGDLNNKNTADLQVRVSLSASQVQPGVDAELNVTRGIASSLDQVLGRVLDPTTGRMKTINDGFDDTIKTLQTAIDRQNDFFEKQQAKLIDEFTTLETTVGQLQQTAQYISAQLTSIGK